MNTSVIEAARALEVRTQGLTRVSLQAKVVVIAALTAVAFAVPRLAGGSPTPLNNLGHAPILVGAYFFGWRGGLLLGILETIVIGPLPGLLGFRGSELFDSTVARGFFFILVGFTTGLLFDRSRAAAEGWRGAAVTIALREREAMLALARGAEAKDTVTSDHISRVRTLTEAFALELGFSPPLASDLGWSAMLHDVGKLHVPDRLLRKRGPLTAREWEIMRRHTVWGAEILQHGEGFELARRIARWHHENFDGSGYPDRLRYEEIPLEVRIVRITDAFDAMTSTRAYQVARPFDDALAELRRGAGSEFDPDLAELFIELITRSSARSGLAA